MKKINVNFLGHIAQPYIFISFTVYRTALFILTYIYYFFYFRLIKYFYCSMYKNIFQSCKYNYKLKRLLEYILQEKKRSFF